MGLKNWLNFLNEGFSCKKADINGILSGISELAAGHKQSDPCQVFM